MTRDINSIVSIIRQKNGKVRITHDAQNERNIYQLLHEFGFCKSKLDNKPVYYRRNANNIMPSNMRDIRIVFFNWLKKSEFDNIPEDIDYSTILNWYLEKQPIKENGLFDHYLQDTLTEEDANKLKLLTDRTYRHKFEVETLLSKLNEWLFSKTTDQVGTFCKDHPVYYKKIEGKKYLLFNHYNSRDKINDGFDCCIAIFNNENQIGNKKPLFREEIRLSFILDRDYSLIEAYLKGGS